MKRPTKTRVLLFLSLTFGALSACVEPPSGSAQGDQGAADQDMAADMIAPPSDLGDVDSDGDMDPTRRGEIQLVVSPELTALEVGRAVDVTAIYVVDGAEVPDAEFEWYLGEMTLIDNTLRLESTNGNTATIVGRAPGEGRLVVRSGDVRKEQLFVIDPSTLQSFPRQPFDRLELLLEGESIDLSTLLVGISAKGWERPLRDWCDEDTRTWATTPGGAVSLSEDGGTLTAVRPGLGRFTVSCVLPGESEVFTIDTFFRVEPRYQTVAGPAYSCALQPSGGDNLGDSVYCWGENKHRQIRLDDSAEHPLPQEIDFDKPIRQLDVAASHGCAVDNEGNVSCWGSNVDGQVAPEDDTGEAAFAPIPVDLSSSTAVKVCAGERSSCALTSRGEVFCWGTNTASLLNRNTSVIVGSKITPTKVPFDNGATFFHDLACGPEHRCAIDATNRAHCWGADSHGQLGAEDFDPQNPKTSTIVSDGNAAAIEFEQVFAGPKASCGITPEGYLHCWGAEYVSRGRGGDGAPIAATNRPFWGIGDVRSEALLGEERIVTVSMGGEHLCASSSDGEVFCWGEGRYGELAAFDSSPETLFGELLATPEALEPIVFERAAEIASVAVGLDHSCAITRAGQPFCWGDGARGQRGNDTTGIALSRQSMIVARTIFDPATDPVFFELSRSATGLDYTCVNALDPSEVYCWGNPRWGRAGVGAHQSLFPAPGAMPNVAPQLVDMGGEAQPRDVLGGGDRHACSNFSSDGFSCWGDDLFEQTGGTPDRLITAPTAIFAEMGMIEEASFLVGGRAHSCYHNTTDDRVYCWGDATRGAVGVMTFQETNPGTVNLAYEVDGLQFDQSLRGLTARDDYTCAWGDKVDEIRCWGAIPSVLFDPTDVGGVAIEWDAAVFDDPSKDDVVLSVAAGSQHLCAAVEENDPMIYCYGDNSKGQRGVDDIAGEASNNFAWTATTGAPEQLVAGRDHTCALAREDTMGAPGQVFCWGDNSFGQSGFTATNVIARPTVITEPTLVPGVEDLDVLQISAGAYHTCAIGSKADEMRVIFEVVCWGRDSYGQITGLRTHVQPVPLEVERAQ